MIVKGFDEICQNLFAATTIGSTGNEIHLDFPFYFTKSYLLSGSTVTT